MIAPTNEFLGRWLAASDKLIEGNLSARQAMLKRYAGPAWQGGDDESGGGQDADNQALGWLTLFKAYAAMSVPMFTAESRRGGLAAVDAAALQDVMARWMNDTDFVGLLDEAADDFGFNYAVLLVSREVRPEFAEAEDPLFWPQASVIDPSEFRYDPTASRRKRWRGCGHYYVRDANDLLEIAKDDKGKDRWEQSGWNADVIEALTTDTGREKIRRPAGHTLRMGELVLFDYYDPNYELPWARAYYKGKGTTLRAEGFNGTWFTIAVRDDSGISMERALDGSAPSHKSIEQAIEDGSVLAPREPRPAFCAKGGPYHCIAALNVPGYGTPLGVLQAAEGQTRKVNDADAVLERRMARKKTGIAYDSRDEQTAIKLKNAGDDEYVGIPHLGEDGTKIVPFVTGGIDDTDVFWRNDRRDLRDRNLGLPGAVQGSPQANTTATADMIGSQSSTARMDYFTGKFLRGMLDVLKGVAHLFWYDPQMAWVVGTDSQSALYVGGHPSRERLEAIFKLYPEFEPDSDEEFEEVLEYIQQERGRFSDLAFQLDLTTAGRDTEERRAMRAMTADGLLTTILPLAPQLETFYDVGEHLRRTGRDRGLEWVARGYNRDAAAAIAGQEALPSTGAPPATVRLPVQPGRLPGGNQPFAGLPAPQSAAQGIGRVSGTNSGQRAKQAAQAPRQGSGKVQIG